MILFTVVLMSLVLGFGSGVVVAGRRRERSESPRELRPVDMLLKQTRWLPVARIGHQRCDELGYPSSTGQKVTVVELDGGIRLIAEDKPSNSAFLEHAGMRIGLSIKKRHWLGLVLRDRIAEQAMADASMKLLES